MKQNNLIISVIIPTFNSEKFLRPAIDSALNQTFTGVEVIVVDDGSTDSTIDIVNEIIQSDNRVRLLRKDHTGNVGKNSNDAVKVSNGDYVAKLDSDDVWRPDKLEQQIKYINDYSLICSDARQIDGKGKLLSDCYHCLGSDRDVTLTYLLKNNYIIASTILINKSLFWKYGGYEQNLGYRGEDYHLWLKFASENKIKYLNDTLVDYRIHGSNLSEFSVQEKIELQENTIRIRSEYLDGYSKEVNYASKEGIILALKEQVKLFIKMNDYHSAAHKSHKVIKLYNKRFSIKFIKNILLSFYLNFIKLFKSKKN